MGCFFPLLYLKGKATSRSRWDFCRPTSWLPGNSCYKTWKTMKTTDDTELRGWADLSQSANVHACTVETGASTTDQRETWHDLSVNAKSNESSIERGEGANHDKESWKGFAQVVVTPHHALSMTGMDHGNAGIAPNHDHAQMQCSIVSKIWSAVKPLTGTFRLSSTFLVVGSGR